MKHFMYIICLATYLSFMTLSCGSRDQGVHEHPHEHGEGTHDHSHEHEHPEQEEFVVEDTTATPAEKPLNHGHKHENGHQH
jgi:hypothetical protein